jgi:predicted nucleotidyltransferase
LPGVKRSEAQYLPGLDEVRNAVAELASDQPLRLVVLFGSMARGDAGARDVDLGLLAEGRLDLVDLTNRLTRRLGCQNVDLADLGRADPLLMALVARDGLVLHEGRPGEFARFASLAARRFADTAKFRDAERQYIADFIRETAVAE